MDMREPSPYLLLNYLQLAPEKVQPVRALLLEPRQNDARFFRSVYLHEAGDRVLELVGLPDLAATRELVTDPAWADMERRLRPLLFADFRRQVHELRAQVKSAALDRAPPPHMQLRRIEVPPPRLDEYHAWREETLFAYGRKRPEIDAFAAYHSVISTEPGVLFLSWFSCSTEQYLASFQTPEYQEWIKYAGAHFIAGGSNALHTSTWTRQ